MIVYKIVSCTEWMAGTGDYAGSAEDRADGFVHLSTAAQLPETLRLHYANADALMLVAADATALGDSLKWEHAPSRGQDFPHLYGVLPCDAMVWARPIMRGTHGNFVLPI